MGGRNIEQIKNISIARIIRTYEKFGTARKAAQVLGITHQTVCKYLKKAGVTLKKSGWDTWNKLRVGKESYKHSQFADWLREHPRTTLPRDAREISKITGVSLQAVRSYFKRQYNKSKYYISKLGDFKQYDAQLTAIDSEGEDFKWPLNKLSRYIYSVDRYDHTVVITGVVNAQDGEYVVHFKPINVLELYLLCGGE